MEQTGEDPLLGLGGQANVIVYSYYVSKNK